MYNINIGLSNMVLAVLKGPRYDSFLIDGNLIPINHFYESAQAPDTVILYDHLYGFDKDGNNQVLQKLSDISSSNNKKILVSYPQILPLNILQKYPNLDIRFNSSQQIEVEFDIFDNINIADNVVPTNFLMTLLGTDNIGRWLLCAALDKAGWLNLDYSSKNLGFDIDTIDSYIRNNVPATEEPYYFNRLINLERRQFYLDIQHDNSWRTGPDYQFPNRMTVLDPTRIFDVLPKIEKCFLYVVSEAMSASYVPYITEKVLYSILPGNLFLAYAQPGWHASLKHNYGFKMYEDIFDYSFDAITNPVKRLDTLLNTIQPYSNMTPDEWMDIYKLTKDTREFNKHHFLSGDCYKTIRQRDTWTQEKWK